MNRKPLFDVVRQLLGGKLSTAQVSAIDAAVTTGLRHPTPDPHSQHRLGLLSERFECGNRGPGAVSTGRNDPGGASYGLFQLASRTGTCAAFLSHEGKKWQARFNDYVPGSDEFSAIWRDVAKTDQEAFSQAQRDFIARTHYFPAVAGVKMKTGLDLDGMHQAIRDAAWSTAVQHGGAVHILSNAVSAADRQYERSNTAYERTLIETIYDERTAYVLRVAKRPKLSHGEKMLLESLVRNRFVAERAEALKMLLPADQD